MYELEDIVLIEIHEWVLPARSCTHVHFSDNAQYCSQYGDVNLDVSDI